MRLCVDRSEFGNDLPWVATDSTRLPGVLDPDDRDLLQPRFLNHALDIRHHCVTLVVPIDHAGLRVDDEECGIWPVLECGHRSPLCHLDCVHLYAGPATPIRVPSGSLKWPTTSPFGDVTGPMTRVPPRSSARCNADPTSGTLT